MTKRYLIKGAIYKSKNSYDHTNEKYDCFSPVHSGSGMYVVDCWVCDSEGNIAEGLNVSPIPVMVDWLGEIVGELERI